MYTVVLFVLVLLGVVTAARGIARSKRQLTWLGVGIVAATAAFFGLMSFWAEMLWYEHLGFTRRFWTAVLGKASVALAGAIVAIGLVWVLTAPLQKHGDPAAPGVRAARSVGAVIGAIVGAMWGTSSWSVALKWVIGMNVDSGTREPIHNIDASFYLFSLPFYDSLLALGFVAVVVSAFVAIGASVVRSARLETARRSPDIDMPEQSLAAEQDALEPYWAEDGERRPAPRHAARVSPRPIYVIVGAFALLLAVERVLQTYHILFASTGVVQGPGYTDVHVRLPAYYVAAAVSGLAGLVLLIPSTCRALERRVMAGVADPSPQRIMLRVVAAQAAVVAGVWVVGLGVLPLLVQWLKVQPNELALERPYLENSIALTRRAFGLDRVEEREFEVGGELTPTVVNRNEHLLREVRLWDPHALDEVLEQFQEIRLYYEITKVDIDRYMVNGRYRQMMVAPREMETANLPFESRTFVNRHFKYTHGFGLAMVPVSDFTQSGLPNLVVRDLPPVSDYATLAVSRPEIYYGERTHDFVVANSETPEFDYPQGAENVYTRYEGRGGVELRNFWRKLVFGWKLGSTRLLFSTYPKDDSRIMFHRQVRDRVAKVAPFLKLDGDPYIVLVDGKLQWIIDAYTTSSYFPYSERYETYARPVAPIGAGREGASPPPGGPARRPWSLSPDQTPAHDVPAAETAAGRGELTFAPSLSGVNYVRNSVKAVVDAYDGSVSLYVFEPGDPIVRVWSEIFPDLFRPASEMPASLRAHVRYPEELLNAQGQVYAKFHMTDPVVFYNREDLWVRATEKHYGSIRPVDPYYVMWQPPGTKRAEFILMQPYTPKNRQVLIGWIAGMCDGENYGRLLAYRFPKDKWVLGPQQVDTKIDQSPELSAQLTLWDQLGKRVIRGNVLAIPIGQTILYVEPIYLQAEAAAYPELRMVVTMHGDDMSYASRFEDALEGLIDKRRARERAEATDRGEPAPAAAAVDSTTAAALERARSAFDAYLRAMTDGRFEDAGAELRALRDALKPVDDLR